jgi:hypothetical protein
VTQQAEPTITLDPDIPDNVIDALVSAYYPKIIGLPDDARTRAQAGFAIASGIATALFALSLFTDLQDFDWYVWALGVASLVAWVAAAGAYIRAVALPTNPESRLVTRDNFADLTQSILRNAVNERRAIDKRQLCAVRLAGVAAFLTFVAIGVALSAGKASDGISGRIVFSAAGLDVISASCQKLPPSIEGTVESTSMADDLALITLDPGSCQDDKTAMILPRSLISEIFPR